QPHAPHNEATTSTPGIEFLKHLFQSLQLLLNKYKERNPKRIDRRRPSSLTASTRIPICTAPF
ncbi:MAG: hypothetical protein K2W95_29950, partial [Candidatus Obscuribacterales bacterium]|nr:hypothetical protein [Candidatus Obscuribacterales bacterium]